MILSFLFSVSLLGKIFSIHNFLDSIKSFQLSIIKGKSVVFIACTVLLLEFYICLSLALNLYIRLTYVIIIITMTFFNLLFVYAGIRKQNIQCNCFGNQKGNTNIIYAIVRNLIIIICSITGYFIAPNEYIITISNIHLLLVILLFAFSYVLLKEIKMSSI